MTRKFERAFGTEAITMPVWCVLEGVNMIPGTHVRQHPDMWVISGKIVEDYYYWVNDFKATHIIYGTIEGNFETGITGPSDEVIDKFLETYPPSRWDYYDI